MQRESLDLQNQINKLRTSVQQAQTPPYNPYNDPEVQLTKLKLEALTSQLQVAAAKQQQIEQCTYH